MIQLAINILWLLIGIICLCGVVWLAIYVIGLFTPIPDVIVKMIWAIVLILILIGVLTLLTSGGGGMRAPFHFGGITGPAIAAGSYAPTLYLPRMLT